MRILFLSLIVLLAQSLHANEIVFIQGYHNEKIENYFTKHKSILLEKGHRSVSIISPRSENSVALNSIILARQLKKLKGPLYIVAHSKGGVEAFNTLLQNPDLAQRTKALILVQSPIKGSPYADYFWNKEDRKNQWNPYYWSYSRSNYAGLLSMRVKDVENLLTKSAANSTLNDLQVLSNITYFWRSSSLAPGQAYAQYQEGLVGLGPNDGIVPTDSMILQSIGSVDLQKQDLGVFRGFNHLQAVTFSKKEPEKTNHFLATIKDLLPPL